MLRQDAEDNSPPNFVLTLTSVRVDWTSAEYGRACATFWQAFRRRWGHVEYCGFVEWTTGTAERSGGHRRQHVHWLLKVPDPETIVIENVQAWVSEEWRKLTGAWRVELAALETVGGVVGYLALHHEKWEQRPPNGWTGRRLRPSRGYFAEPGHVRRARAQLWLQQHRHGQEHPEHGYRATVPPVSGRIVWRGRTWTEEEGVRSSRVLDTPGRSFDSLPARRELERRLLDPSAPIHADHLDGLAQDYEVVKARALYRERMAVVERWRSRSVAAGAGGRRAPAMSGWPASGGGGDT